MQMASLQLSVTPQKMMDLRRSWIFLGSAHNTADKKFRNMKVVPTLWRCSGLLWGSIRVPQLVGLESYSAVHHLTSVVEGQLQDGLNWVDLLKACWPGGSISGAPKLRACQRLHELEPTSRGPYCGSLLRIDWDGTFDSNILIRSLLRQGDTLRAHAGCGIVADSDPDSEAEELMWKMQPLLEALS